MRATHHLQEVGDLTCFAKKAPSVRQSSSSRPKVSLFSQPHPCHICGKHRSVSSFLLE